MFDEQGLMRKTKKSALYKMFNEVEEASIPKLEKHSESADLRQAPQSPYVVIYTSNNDPALVG